MPFRTEQLKIVFFLSGHFNLPFIQIPGMAALTKPRVLVSQALVDRQQGTNVPSLIMTITTPYLED